METLEDRLKVFVSHSWNDKDLAEDLHAQLSPFFRVWMDNRELRAGDDIDRDIDRALAGIDVMVLLWSRNSADPRCGVADEIETALALEKRIIPCFRECDAQGRPAPPLPERLARLIAVDFTHPNRGAADLLEHLFHFRNRNLPREARPDDADAEAIASLRRFLQFSGDRQRRGREYDRETWAGNAADAMVRLARGNPALAATLLEALRRNTSNDPAVAGILGKLEAAVGDAGDRPAVRAARFTESPPPPPRTAPHLAPPPPADDLSRRLAAIVPPGQVAAAAALVRAYLASATPTLQGMIGLAHTAGSPAFANVVSSLGNYLVHPADLIPDSLGEFGLLDDAWLILNTGFRLIESGLVDAGALPLPWDVMRSADHLVRALMPGDVSAALEELIHRFLLLISAEVQGYRPWFTPDGAGGYSATVAAPASSGGCWEDQMNTALLGTGLSV